MAPRDEEQAEHDETSPLVQKHNRASNGYVDGHATNSQGQASTSQQDDGTSPTVKEPTTKELVAIMSAIWLAAFFAALDSTIVATLTATISSDFDSLSLFSWLATGYLISNAVCQPVSGKLTDIFGRRAGLIFSNFFFGVGTLICGLAQREWVIILGRVVAGIGGGCLTSITSFVASDLVPLRRRGVWQGYAATIFGLGMGLGGPFGGWINDVLGWRWAFLIQLPFIVVSTILTWFLVKIPVKESNKPSLARIDFLGSALLVVSLVLCLFGLNTGGSQLPWSHPLIIASLVLSAVLFLGFLYVEDRVATEPIIPVRLMGKTRTVLAACLTCWFSSMTAFVVIYYLPLYLQVRGLSSTQAGLRIIPLTVGSSTGALGAGYVMRVTGKYYLLIVTLLAITVVGSGLMCTLDLDSPLWTTFVFPVPFGLGYGGLLTATMVAMISAVKQEDQAVITAASFAFRSTGSTIGVTIAGAVFQNVLTKELRDKYGGLPHSEQSIKKIKDSLDAINHLPAQWKKQIVLKCYMDGFRGAFQAGLCLAALALISALFMKEHVLHSNLSRRPSQGSS